MPPQGRARNAVVPDVAGHGVEARDVAAQDVAARDVAAQDAGVLAAVHNTVAAVQVASADSLAAQAAIGAEYE